MADEIQPLESLEGIPAFLHSSFKEVDGKFAYQDPTTGLSNKNRDLLGKLAKEKNAREEAEAARQSLLGKLTVDDEQVDPDELPELLRKARAAAKAEANGDGKDKDTISRAEALKEKAEALRKAKADADKRESDLSTKVQQLTSQIEEYVIIGALRSWCDELAKKDDAPFRLAPGASEALETFLRAEKPFTVGDDNKLVPKPALIDGDGNEIQGIEGWGAFKVKSVPCLAMPSTGSGATPSRNGAPTAKNRSQMSTDEKVDYVTKHGREKFESLPM